MVPPVFTKYWEGALFVGLGLLVVLIGIIISPVLLCVYLKNKIKDHFEMSD